MADEEKRELRPFVLKFSTMPELYAVNTDEKGQLDFKRTEKLQLSDLIRVGSDATTSAITTEYWSGEQSDSMTDYVRDD
jgi:hypothetical protein